MHRTLWHSFAFDRSIWLVIACSIIGGTFFTLMLPLGGLLLAERGYPAWQIGLVGGVPWGALLLSTIATPYLLQVFSARRLYYLSRLLALAAALLFIATEHILLWSLAYACLGLSGGLAWVIGDALLASTPPPEQRVKVMSTYMFLVNFVIILGPMLVALLGTGTLSFLVGVALAVLAALLTLLIRFPVQEQTPERRGPALLWHIAVPMLGLLMITLSTGSFEGSAGKMLPVQAYGLGYGESIAAWAATLSGAGNLLSQLALMLLLRRFTAHQLIGKGMLALLAAVLLIAPLAYHLIGYLSVIFIAGGIAGALYTLIVLEVTAGTTPTQSVNRISCIATVYTLGGVIGPMLVGAALSAAPQWGYSLAMALITLLALVLYQRWPYQPERTP